MKFRSLLLLLCAAIAPVGICAADISREAGPPANDPGILLLSITREGMLSSYRVWFRQVERVKGPYVEHGCNLLGPRSCFQNDFKQVGLEGQLLAVKLPPGEYEFYSWAAVSADCNRTEATAPFSIKFRVQPGRITYAGNFHFTQTAKRALVVTGAEVSYGMQVERDLAVLQLKYPALQSDRVDSGSPQPAMQKPGGDGKYRYAIPCGQWASEHPLRSLPSDMHPEPKPAYGPR